jgi:hypothetical protein
VAKAERTDSNLWRVLNALGVVALRRSMPKHPDRPLSYFWVALPFFAELVALVALINLATDVGGALRAVLIFGAVLMALLAALSGVGLFLAIKMRKSIVEQMRPAVEEDRGIER